MNWGSPPLPDLFLAKSKFASLDSLIIKWQRLFFFVMFHFSVYLDAEYRNILTEQSVSFSSWSRELVAPLCSHQHVLNHCSQLIWAAFHVIPCSVIDLRRWHVSWLVEGERRFIQTVNGPLVKMHSRIAYF